MGTGNKMKFTYFPTAIEVKHHNNIQNIYEYMAMLGELKKGEKLIVEIERDGDLIKLEIQL